MDRELKYQLEAYYSTAYPHCVHCKKHLRREFNDIELTHVTNQQLPYVRLNKLQAALPTHRDSLINLRGSESSIYAFRLADTVYDADVRYLHSACIEPFLVDMSMEFLDSRDALEAPTRLQIVSDYVDMPVFDATRKGTDYAKDAIISTLAQKLIDKLPDGPIIEDMQVMRLTRTTDLMDVYRAAVVIKPTCSICGKGNFVQHEAVHVATSYSEMDTIDQGFDRGIKQVRVMQSKSGHLMHMKCAAALTNKLLTQQL